MIIHAKSFKTYFYIIIVYIISGIPIIIFAQDTLNTIVENDQCISCHIEEEVLPEDFNKDDVHLVAGLSCSGCHGGDAKTEDMDEAMASNKGFIGIPAKSEIPRFCGKCHSDILFMRTFQPRIPTDQVNQYFTSVHGQKLKQGDSKVADCTSCHSAHSILHAKDSRSTVYALNVPHTCNKCHGDENYMKDYNLSTNQYKDYAESVHGIALLENQDIGSPACNDCHGNHGAMPPGISSISHVCGTCHVHNMQYFSSTKMSKAFEQKNLHACEECHGNHKVEKTFDEMIGTSDKAVCIKCHKNGDKGFEVAAQINNQLLQVVTAYDSASNKRIEVQRIGMDDVDIGYLLQESHQSLIQARTLTHTFDPNKVGEKTTEGLNKATLAIQLAESEIHEFDIRRKGFGIATLFITIFVIALFFKIREIEKK